MSSESTPVAAGIRFRNLDCLRGVAILLVLGRHGDFHWLWYRIGWGVDFFFVLSGFLVSGLIFREYQRRGRVDLWRFWLRRALRIYPPFLLMIAVTVAAGLLVSEEFDGKALLAELTWTQNYLPGLWPSTWSLAVEEHFYVILPIALGLLMYRRPSAADPFTSLPRAMLAIGAGFLAARILNANLTAGADWLPSYTATHLRLDSLFFGVLLSYAFHFHKARLVSGVQRYRRAIGVFAVVSLLAAGVWPIEHAGVRTVGLTVIYLGWGSVLLLALTQEVRASVPFRALSFVGARAYSIYLWHLFVLRYTSLLLPRTEFAHRYSVKVALYLGLSIAVGYVLHRFVEAPSIKLRNILMPDNTSVAGSRLEEARPLAR